MRASFLVAAMVLAAGVACGCNSSNGTQGSPATHADMAGARDLAVPAPGPDLAMSLDDLSMAFQYRYVINTLTLPLQRAQFSIDLNGDGRADNQLASIIQTLGFQGIDPQVAVDNSLTTGTTIELLKVSTNDRMIMDDKPVAVTVYTGLPGKPDFSGNGKFAIDVMADAADFTGTLRAAAYDSESPIDTKRPVTVPLVVSLFLGGPPITLTFHGAHLAFTASGANGLGAGSMQGSMKASEVQSSLIPAIAALLTNMLKMNPNSPQSMQIEAMLDIGGCGTAKANDFVIDSCEVAQNQLIQGLLAPDVQIYDDQGNYAPSAQNTKKDSLSLGIGFTAVRAKF